MQNTKLVTPVGRIVFHKNLWTPNENGKYTASLVLAEDQANNDLFKKLVVAIKETAKEKFGGKVPKKLVTPIKLKSADDFEDGDYEFLYGNFVINAATKFPVEVIGTDKDYDGNYEEIFDDKNFKAGDNARFVISPYAWEYQGKQGVSFNLITAQKVGDNEAFYKAKRGAEYLNEVELDAEYTTTSEDNTELENQDF